MPPEKMITKDHMKLVLTGKKDFLKMNQVKFINVPAYDEIGVKAMYSKVMQMEGMERYFPSKYPKGTQCEKGYLYNVWNSLHPDVVKKVIDHANSQRFAMTAEKVQKESINITEG